MKIAIEIIDLELEKMYRDALKIDPADQQRIDEHCRLVESFIESCGYSVEEYTRHMLGFDSVTN